MVMDTSGIVYQLELGPFALRGVVGGEAQLQMRNADDALHQRRFGAPINGRRDVEELIDKLYTLQHTAAELNGNKGPWAYNFSQLAQEQTEEPGDGISV